MQQQQHQMNDDVINEFVFVCFEAKTEEKKHLLCTKQTFLLLIHLKTKKKFLMKNCWGTTRVVRKFSQNVGNDKLFLAQQQR